MNLLGQTTWHNYGVKARQPTALIGVGHMGELDLVARTPPHQVACGLDAAALEVRVHQPAAAAPPGSFLHCTLVPCTVGHVGVPHAWARGPRRAEEEQEAHRELGRLPETTEDEADGAVQGPHWRR